MIEFMAGAAVGIAYAFFLCLTAPHLLHFLPVISLVHSMYYAFLFGVLFTVLVPVFSKKVEGQTPRFLSFIPLLVISTHCFVWLYWYSYIGELGLGWAFLFSFLVATIVGYLTWRYILFLREASGNRRLFLPFFVILLGALLGLRLIAAFYVPSPWLTQISRVTPKKTYGQVLFPFSLRMDRALQRYGVLLPEVPDGEKIIVFVLDAFRNDYLGRKISGVQVTPNMKHLAEENVYFDNYRVQAPATKASVASFFTGKYVREHGVFEFFNEDNVENRIGHELEWDDELFGHVLSGRFRTLAERLQDEGYKTGGAVKIGHISDRFNYDQGFDLYTMSGGTDASTADLSTLDSLLFWLLRNQPRKAFLYFHLVGPHYPYPMGEKNLSFWRRTPYYENRTVGVDEWGLDDISDLIQTQLSEEEWDQNGEEIEFIRHLYASDLHYYDQFVVPRFIEAFEALGIYQESFFTITSDHGENLYDHDRFYGHARNLYEETINVPLIVKFPQTVSEAAIPDDTRIQSNVESIDLTATILEFAGANHDGISGESFMPFFRGENRTDTFQVSLSEKSGRERVESAAVVRNEWKLIHDYRDTSVQLYNLKQDPGEQNPVTSGRPDNGLRSILEERLGEGNQFKNGTSWMKGFGREERKNLEALGYF